MSAKSTEPDHIHYCILEDVGTQEIPVYSGVTCDTRQSINIMECTGHYGASTQGKIHHRLGVVFWGNQVVHDVPDGVVSPLRLV